MHHRKKKTSTREWSRRADMKSYRMRERQAINEGSIAATPRSSRWSYRPEPLPIIDAECSGAVQSKRKTPKKAKNVRPESCKGGHTWYEEDVEVTTVYEVCTKPDCPYRTSRLYPSFHTGCCEYRTTEFMGKPYRIVTKRYFERVYETKVVHKKTCIECWEERIVQDPEDMKPRWRTRNKRRKIRTQDTVSGMTVGLK